MPNQSEIVSYGDGQLDKFAQALATARKMQQDWLTYGLNFVQIYVEDVDGDWLETWGNDEIVGNPLLDKIKEFLVSDDSLAVKVRHQLKKRSLFDFAVNLAECGQINEETDRLSAVRNLLVDDDDDAQPSLDLANELSAKLF
ncbi:hypothetical protein H6G76_20355 [Nostoc sp. FACHB-152]|uniref:hypothetical protein n=1 Tax=Nostoc sp. FACHB-152 TaxID=2692837 RepID=UPI0016822C38|nr:hypothetical protein [Nostoc sp. FACHB-152]MBD2449472.1 hypothetical protein [Nostoc sp. FACHB-152]